MADITNLVCYSFTGQHTQLTEKPTAQMIVQINMDHNIQTAKHCQPV